ncbi:MAG: glucose 1-dehydrogenase [Pseudomonadales bacterium]
MSSARFSGRCVLISGGASGIGAATARMMAAEGARVLLGDVDLELARTVAGEIGTTARALHLDVTDEASWQNACATALREFGALHVLVNSAGISVPANVEEATLEHWRQTMSINADGVFLGCKHGVRAIRTCGGGAIVNLASTLGARPGSIYAAYSASKAAVLAVTRSTALHCAEQRYAIRCNAVLPGATHTPMVDAYLDNAPDPAALMAQFESVHPLGRIGRPEDIAHGVLYLASDDAAWVTGVALPVDGGFLAA